jgi:hypothetical protein
MFCRHNHEHPDFQQHVLCELDTLFQQNQIIIQNQENIMKELDDLKAEVARNTTVEKSALALIQGFKGQLDAAIASGNPQALKDLSTQLGANDDELAAAVAANTPAAPPTPAP